ncbi:MAG: helix-turn-helix transcriptional regulator [Gemmatimonadota bacterium]|nr:helix-turn-helix transcriptional regulator [Gemmatimonadota bacterium]
MSQPAPATMPTPDRRTARAQSHLKMIRDGVRSDRAIASVLGVSHSQVSRWRQGQRPDRENADRLAGLALVVEMLLRWLDADIVEEWLTGANPHLDGATPSYFIQRSRLSGVVGAVEAIKTGVFA